MKVKVSELLIVVFADSLEPLLKERNDEASNFGLVCIQKVNDDLNDACVYRLVLLPML